MKIRCSLCVLLVFLSFGLCSSNSLTAAEGFTVLSGARIIDGTGAPPRDNVDITIQNGKITSIATAGSSQSGENAKVIDCKGKTIIPGLITAHAHVGQTNGIQRGPVNFTRENITRQLRQYEAYGVTTVVSLGTNLPLIDKLREEAHSGKLPGADLFGADRGIGVRGGAPGGNILNDVDQINRPRSVEEARRAVQAAKANGTDYIKMWVDDSRGTVPRMSTEVFTAVIDEAHQHNLRVAAHIFNLADAKSLVEAGVDIIAHGVRDQPVDEEFIQAMKANSVWYIPTLALDDAFFVYADRPDWIETPFFRHAVQEDLQQQIDDPAWRKETLANPRLQASRDALRMNQRNLAVLYEAGVQIGFGTDSGALPLRIPGFAEHREMTLMAEAGIPSLEIIRISTGQTARLLHLEDRGTLVAGQRADLIILESDPSEDIANTSSIEAVWHRGKRVAGAATEFTP